MKELVSDFSHHKIKIYYLKHYYEQNLYQVLISIRVRIISFKKGSYFDSAIEIRLILQFFYWVKRSRFVRGFILGRGGQLTLPSYSLV